MLKNNVFISNVLILAIVLDIAIFLYPAPTPAPISRQYLFTFLLGDIRDTPDSSNEGRTVVIKSSQENQLLYSIGESSISAITKNAAPNCPDSGYKAYLYNDHVKIYVDEKILGEYNKEKLKNCTRSAIKAVSEDYFETIKPANAKPNPMTNL